MSIFRTSSSLLKTSVRSRNEIYEHGIVNRSDGVLGR